MSAPTITERTCQAWWLLEAAELRGLPLPRGVDVNADSRPTSLRLASVDEINTWAEALDTDVKTNVDNHGNTHHTVKGELHDFAVELYLVELAPAELVS